MDPRADQILPSPLGPPNLRPGCPTPIMQERGGQPRPTAYGLGGGGLGSGPEICVRGMWPPGHLPCQECLCHAGEPLLPGELDEGGRRVCPATVLRHGRNPVGEPPLQPPEELLAKAAREGSLMLIIAPEWPGPLYPWWTTLCALCPRRWQLPQDRPLYLRGSTDLMPAPRWRTWAFLMDSREGSQSGTHRPPQPTLPPVAPPGPEPPRGADMGAQLMTEHRHTDTLPLRNRPGKLERKRDVQRFHPEGPPEGAPTTRSANRPLPSSLGPPSATRRTLFHPRVAAQSSSGAPPQAGPPSEGPAPGDRPMIPMASDPEPLHEGPQAGTRAAPPPTTRPM